MDISGIECVVLDVDGVLTPGDVSFDDDGGRTMSFDIHDGWALQAWRRSGGKLGILSGRRSVIVDRRAQEIGVEVCHQGVQDKRVGVEALLGELGVEAKATCYVGDDVPDLPALKACGFAVAVSNAVPTVKRQADYVTRRAGGSGAVAEVVELLLRKKGCWSGVVNGG